MITGSLEIHWVPTPDGCPTSQSRHWYPKRPFSLVFLFQAFVISLTAIQVVILYRFACSQQAQNDVRCCLCRCFFFLYQPRKIAFNQICQADTFCSAYSRAASPAENFISPVGKLAYYRMKSYLCTGKIYKRHGRLYKRHCKLYKRHRRL